MEIATPSLWAAPLLAVPLQCRALTSVVSTARWAPPNSANPSTATSSRRPSAAMGAWRSKSRNSTFVLTRPPASLQIRATTEQTPSPRPRPVRRQRGDGQEHRVGGHTGKNARSKGGQSRDPTRGTCGESQTTPRPSLGSQQCLCWVCESREDASLCGASPRVHRPRVANQHHIPLKFFHFVPCGPRSCNHHQSVSNLPSLTQARGDSSSFQMMKKHSGDKRVPSVDHGEAICPIGPMSRTTDTRGLPETKPTQCKWQRVAASPGTL